MSSLSGIQRHRYSGADDLGSLIQFASRSLSTRYPMGATWHPGDVVWELQGQYDVNQPIRFWEAEGVIESVAWLVGPGELWFEATPAGEPLLPDAIAWMEAALRRGRASELPQTLSVRAFHSDLMRIRALQELGFEQAGPQAVQFEFDLSGRLPAAQLPAGFRIEDCEGIDPERRASAHRDAWNDLRRIGIENASSTFSARIYEELRRSPVYTPALDLVVTAPDGALVATCMCWADDASGIGVFEPMGTHPGFRGKRLARALLAEGMRRLRKRGHRMARIGTAHFNTPAIAAYSAVFRRMDHTSWWTKAL